MINSLKNFSRLDEADYQVADLHEGIESTPTFLSPKINDRISIYKEFGDLPKIACYPLEINQVFMNIIGNSVEAIERRGEITIKTFSDEKNVFISISDSGAGIPHKDMKKIFEPEFRTKKSRIGLGMGLYTSHNIILRHKGTLDIESQVGKGTSTTISLPKKFRN